MINTVRMAGIKDININYMYLQCTCTINDIKGLKDICTANNKELKDLKEYRFSVNSVWIYYIKGFKLIL